MKIQNNIRYTNKYIPIRGNFTIIGGPEESSRVIASFESERLALLFIAAVQHKPMDQVRKEQEPFL